MKLINANNELLKEGLFFGIDIDIDLNRFKGENGEINHVSDFLEDIDYDPENDASSIDDDIGFNSYSTKKMSSIEREYEDFREKITLYSTKGYAASFRKKVSIVSFLIYTVLGITVWSEIVFTDKNFTFSLVAGIVFGFYGWLMTFISSIGEPDNRSVNNYLQSCIVRPHIIAVIFYILVTIILWLFQPKGLGHWLLLLGFIALVLFLGFIFFIEWDDKREAKWRAKRDEEKREEEEQENKQRIPGIAKMVVERRVEGTEFEFDTDYTDEYTNEIIELMETNMDITYDFTNEQYVEAIIKHLDKNSRRQAWEQSRSPEVMKIRAENIAELVVEQRVEGTEFEFNEEYIETYTREIINLIDKHFTISNDFSDQEYVDHIIKLIEKHERKMAWEEEGT
ncbi:hypothetical protein [Peribacillus simplex]|uniref:hypothetical protein n=1 Tax=Peribacillus simplex TaxID=1478 RepID=UPI0024C15B33|nr:hypothetical protein [Peribacillus simplex]WHY54323.1 hypothetical protein QNH43_14070 [Peribacillus simplex]